MSKPDRPDKPDSLVNLDRALALFQEAYDRQMRGELDEAVDLYRRSIDVFPTAEAHTFLGWAYSFQGRLDDAIAECRKAIDIDPEFGNPYNDIGAYLIEQGKLEDAVPWLQRALRAERYASYHFAWFNLGRVYLGTELYARASECFTKALEIEPDYEVARRALAAAKKRVH
jgi:tetratricopeptide (TPR) repeat protein